MEYPPPNHYPSGVALYGHEGLAGLRTVHIVDLALTALPYCSNNGIVDIGTRSKQLRV
jgi:hypothetical protein